jgi:hypothetical protein
VGLMDEKTEVENLLLLSLKQFCDAGAARGGIIEVEPVVNIPDGKNVTNCNSFLLLQSFFKQFKS